MNGQAVAVRHTYSHQVRFAVVCSVSVWTCEEPLQSSVGLSKTDRPNRIYIDTGEERVWHEFPRMMICDTCRFSTRVSPGFCQAVSVCLTEWLPGPVRVLGWALHCFWEVFLSPNTYFRSQMSNCEILPDTSWEPSPVLMSGRISLLTVLDDTVVNLPCDHSSRHLQRFWGASGDFWQKQWTKLNVAFEGHDAALFYFGK